jgi:hypothetical protein
MAQDGSLILNPNDQAVCRVGIDYEVGWALPKLLKIDGTNISSAMPTLQRVRVVYEARSPLL